MQDFLIAGAGINGLLLARELAAAQARVVVVEKGLCGKEASWAGGGIVSPLYPWRYDPAITALASWAQGFYPELVAQLKDETGIDAELQRSGLLMLDAEDAPAALEWAQRVRCRMEQLESAAICAQEPRLRPGFQSGLWMPDVANVRNPRLMQALVAGLRRQRQVQILEQTEITELVVRERNVAGARVLRAGQHTELQAGVIVICTGAWTGNLLATAACTLPVTPVKGQMLLYRMAPGLIGSILLTAGRYVIPRQDGHLLVGSTLEHCGFDKTPTAAARGELAAAACRLVPALADQSPIGHWAGLRPGAPGGVPFIGRVPGYENLFVNAGQYRNGLVLAPASARLLADELLARQPILDPVPYQPGNLRG